MNAEQKTALANDLTAYIGQPLDNPLTRSQWMEVARIALASLTAEPMIWHSGDITDLLAEGNIAAHRTGTHVMPLYATPPVPVMKPVVLPKPYGMQDHEKWLKQSEVVAVLLEAGIQIKEANK